MDDRLKLTTTLTGLEDCLVLGRPSRWFSIPGTVVAHVESDFPVGLGARVILLPISHGKWFIKV